MIGIYLVVMNAAMDEVARQARIKNGEVPFSDSLPERRKWWEIDPLWLVLTLEMLVVAAVFAGLAFLILFALFPESVALLIRGWK